MLRKSMMVMTLCSCAASTGVLPVRQGPAPQPELTLVWVGTGEAERLVDGQWHRATTFDYEFTVEQRRYADHWESVKHLRRREPEYDGSAGPREQTMYFHASLGRPDGEVVALQFESTLGVGDGHTDRLFRHASLTFHPELSRWAPFDTYRIEQTYDYEAGRLSELVSLDKGTQPWVRNHERATLFAAHHFDAPPTTR